MSLKELKEKISVLYQDFFVDMKIDKKTGIVEGTNLRFTGFPYIGANYCDAPIKILFVPLDVGKDECFTENTYHSFEDRQSIFSDGNLVFNAHIAGLYATSLYILKNSMGLQPAWEALWDKKEYKIEKAIREVAQLLPKDLLSYVAYENRYRFVTVGRGSEKEERRGGQNRIWINSNREANLLIDEIAEFKPDVIVFQGKDGIWNCHVPELRKKHKVVVAYHPSCWQRRADKLQYIVDYIGPQL